jgi:hypothetical protein
MDAYADASRMPPHAGRRATAPLAMANWATVEIIAGDPDNKKPAKPRT